MNEKSMQTVITGALCYCKQVWMVTLYHVNSKNFRLYYFPQFIISKAGKEIFWTDYERKLRNQPMQN
jgi:hypothetical protein